jgi:hypothetical protein
VSENSHHTASLAGTVWILNACWHLADVRGRSDGDQRRSRNLPLELRRQNDSSSSPSPKPGGYRLQHPCGSKKKIEFQNHGRRRSFAPSSLAPTRPWTSVTASRSLRGFCYGSTRSCATMPCKRGCNVPVFFHGTQGQWRGALNPARISGFIQRKKHFVRTGFRAFGPPIGVCLVPRGPIESNPSASIAPSSRMPRSRPSKQGNNVERLFLSILDSAGASMDPGQPNPRTVAGCEPAARKTRCLTAFD